MEKIICVDCGKEEESLTEISCYICEECYKAEMQRQDDWEEEYESEVEE